MAAIFREVQMEWRGETYTVTPTYLLVQEIEQRVSIASLASRITAGDVPLSHIAFVVAKLLAAAGAKVLPEDVYQDLATVADVKTIRQIVSIVMTAFVPDISGNVAAPSRPGAKKSATSTGRSTTKSR